MRNNEEMNTMTKEKKTFAWDTLLWEPNADDNKMIVYDTGEEVVWCPITEMYWEVQTMTKLEEHLEMTKLTKMDEMMLMMEQLAEDVRGLTYAVKDAVATVEEVIAKQNNSESVPNGLSQMPSMAGGLTLSLLWGVWLSE